METKTVPLEQAKTHYCNGQPRAAITLLRVSIIKSPDDGHLWELMGIILRTEGKPDEALSALETASILKPLTHVGQLALAACYLRTGFQESARAILVFLTARIELPSEHLPELAAKLAILEEYQWALEVCRESVRREPENDQAFFGMAHYMSKCGYSAEKILPVIERAHTLAPKFVTYRISLALKYIQLGNDDKAFSLVSALTTAQIQRIGCPHCVTQIGELFGKFGDHGRHDCCLARARELHAASNRRMQ